MLVKADGGSGITLNFDAGAPTPSLARGLTNLSPFGGKKVQFAAIIAGKNGDVTNPDDIGD